MYKYAMWKCAKKLNPLNVCIYRHRVERVISKQLIAMFIYIEIHDPQDLNLNASQISSLIWNDDLPVFMHFIESTVQMIYFKFYENIQFVIVWYIDTYCQSRLWIW